MIGQLLWNQNFTASKIHFGFLLNRATPTNFKCWEFCQQKEKTSWNMGKCEINMGIIKAKALWIMLMTLI